ncbi:MAG: peptidoglycan-binding domain-containing protein [Thiotrichales bacterium]
MKSKMIKPIRIAIASSVLVVLPVAAQVDATGTLPNAKPGECYAKVIVPAKYETKTEDVVVSEAAERIEVIPAKYDWVEDKVLVKEASFKLEAVPAQYETVTEKIEVKPASTTWMLTTPGNNTKSAGASLVAYAKGAGLPVESAKPGDCFVEYYKPSTYRTETKKVLKKDASEKVEVVPAKYEWVEEKVLVKEATTKVETVPAVYETKTEKVMVSPATTVWKKGRGPKERIDNTTGEIMCLVEVPAVYKTVTKKVIKTPETTKTIEIPAEYKTMRVRKLVEPAKEIRKTIPAEYTEVSNRVKVSEESITWLPAGQGNADAGKPTGNKLCLKESPAVYKNVTKTVLKTPASSKRVEVPAEYKTVRVRKITSPAQEKRIPIPAKIQKVTKKVKIEDERLEWRQILCETNTTPALLKRVQQALKDAGFNPGPIDGQYGSQTQRALDEFQMKNNLPRGGLTLSTLKSLNIEI